MVSSCHKIESNHARLLQMNSPFQTDRAHSALVGNIAACSVKDEVGELFGISVNLART